MWFNNLDSEAIRNRLLAEGELTKQLENLDLDEQDNEDEQEPRVTEETLSLLEAAAEDILLPRVSGISSPEVVVEGTWKHIRANNGDGILELLAEAKESIYVTHLTPEEYTERYVSLQLEKVRQGLIFERIVKFHPDYAYAYEWLDRFLDKNKKPIQRYRQYTIEGDVVLPKNDFMVIDEKYVLLWHRKSCPHHKSDALTFYDDKEIASCFLDVWQSHVPEQGCKSRRMETVVSLAKVG